MRGKRSKQYRKLMEQYSMTFGFREPYQILVDAEMVRDSCRFKMDLTASLERTVHGKAKPRTFFSYVFDKLKKQQTDNQTKVITQCEIRKLYAQKNEPGISEAIDCAKTFERRRCGHHPDEFPEPLSTTECLHSVVDPKDSGNNKHRYVVASQSQEVRRMLRAVRGVPLIYIKRSVMILEPMADESVMVRAREERSKFRAEIKSALGKRSREDAGADEKEGGAVRTEDDEDLPKKKKKKAPGPKGPNPLAVKKPKKKPQSQQEAKPKTPAETPAEQDGEEPAKKKRRRKGKSKSAGAAEGAQQAENGDTEAAAAAGGES
ncbi:fcf1 domain-containing protein [Sarocladium implicatum]|nr:fcf1 domain-containing protein [Sarocladium implicatum]